MREFKFRIWDSRFNKWIDPECVYIDPATGYVHGIHSGGNVDVWKLIQYIGAEDRNGTKVFEDDILLWPEENITMVVSYSDKDAAFVLSNPKTGGGAMANQEYIDNYEVIGNIHQNPELLGE